MRSDLHRSKLENIKNLMNQYSSDCLVYGYEKTVPSLELPDLDDRHVLAAAIVGRCDVIVTQNLKDFPNEVLNAFDIKAQHPDEFLCTHLESGQKLFISAIKEIRFRLKKPAISTKDYLQILKQQRLVKTAAELKQFQSDI